MADPRAFFSVLFSFAEELEAAHAENAEADAGAAAARSDASGLARRDGSHAPSTGFTSSPAASSVSSGAQPQVGDRPAQRSQQGALDRIKQMQRGHHSSSVPAEPQGSRSAAATDSAHDGHQQQLAAAAAATVAVSEQLKAANVRLSTPVAEALLETSRIIQSAEHSLRESARLVQSAEWVRQADALSQGSPLQVLQESQQVEASQWRQQRDAAASPFASLDGLCWGRPAQDEPAMESAVRQWQAAASAAARYKQCAGAEDEECAPLQPSRPVAPVEDAPSNNLQGSMASLGSARLLQRLTLSPASTPLSRMSSARLSQLSGSQGSGSGRLLAAMQRSESPAEERLRRGASAQARPSLLSTRGPGPAAQEFAAEPAPGSGEPTPRADEGGQPDSAEGGQGTRAAPELSATGAPPMLPLQMDQLSPRQQLVVERRVEAMLAEALQSRMGSLRSSADPAGWQSRAGLEGCLRRSIDGASMRRSLQAGGPSKRVSFSLPGSPRRSSGVEGPADLARVADRLQQHLGRAASEAGEEPAHSSPTFADLLHSVPTAVMPASRGEGATSRPRGRWQLASAADAGPTPSPISHTTRDLAAQVAAVAARAGNSPTGPLARGVRDSEALDDSEAAQELRASAASLPPAAVHLLEPLMPAPLGEGARGSHTIGEGVPPAVLRASLEVPRRLLRHAHSEPVQRLGQLTIDCDLGGSGGWEAARDAGADGGGGAGDDELPGSAYCVQLGGLSPAHIAMQHAQDGGEMSPATAALQQVWPDVDLVSDGAAHFVASGYGGKPQASKFHGIRRLLGIKRQ